MQDRIKTLRGELHLTQAKFAERLRIKPNTISQYESGRNDPTDAVISLICREFNVREEWLRTGSGEMFEETPETALAELSKDYDLDDLDRRMILGYLKLSAAERAVIKRYMENVLNGTTEKPRQRPVNEMTREELHAELDRQLDLERKEETSPASSSDTSEKIS